MDQKDRHIALSLLVNEQEDCSSIEVTIGGVDDDAMVEHDTLYIQKCPPTVVEALQDEGFKLSMCDRGMRVEKY